MSVHVFEQATLSHYPPTSGDSASAFHENFNRTAFEFSHQLASHPLFDLPRLLELSKVLPNDRLYYDAGDIRVNQRWDQTPRTELTVDQLIDRIENAGAWIVMKYIQLDPQYRVLLDDVLAEVRKRVGQAFPRKLKKSGVHVFITSPNRITPYHIDRDCNFLFQICGSKEIAIYDKSDREVLPHAEIERLWGGDKNAAIFKEQFRERGRIFALKPGRAVHIPVYAPHWVKNGNNVSITMSMSFHLIDSASGGNIYHWNRFLRKAGLTPCPPGQSTIRDALKNWTMGGAVGLYRVVKKALGRDS
jgi:hypothetical protein